MSLLGDQIVDHPAVGMDDDHPLLGRAITGREFNELRDELLSLRRPGGLTRDRINAVLGIVPVTHEEARLVVRAVLDLRPDINEETDQ